MSEVCSNVWAFHRVAATNKLGNHGYHIFIGTTALSIEAIMLRRSSIYDAIIAQFATP